MPIELRTPVLVVDTTRLDANIARVANRAAAQGVALRPHVKTHKCLEIARRQVEAGAAGITVATVGEAEVFVAAGFTDVFLAYPCWVTEALASRLTALAARARLRIGVESVTGAARLAGLAGTGITALVEVDSGHHRTGCHPEEAGEVGRHTERAGVPVQGVFTFPGHSYAPGAGRSAAAEEAAALLAGAAALEAAGIEARVLSGGSSPSLAHADARLTELRPGVYVVGDAQQWELGACTPDQVALTCHSRVISVRGRRLVLDVGSKVLGADRPAWASGHGRLLDHADARIKLCSEHHAVVELGDHADPVPEPGAVLRVVPNHACNAINLVEELAVDRPDGPRWQVAARGRND